MGDMTNNPYDHSPYDYNPYDRYIKRSNPYEDSTRSPRKRKPDKDAVISGPTGPSKYNAYEKPLTIEPQWDELVRLWNTLHESGWDVDEIAEALYYAMQEMIEGKR
jgi:hypothetical protein